MAGVVVRVGSRVRGFKPGDEVYARPDKDRIGTFAEFPLAVLNPGGKLISISGPPDPDFAAETGLSWMLKQVIRLLSYRIRKKANRRGVSYSFVFMRASGSQLREITSLIDSGVIRPVVERVFPFDATNEAMAYVETGRAKGKVVVRVSHHRS